jgi:Protein of unknown function, DUF481
LSKFPHIGIPARILNTISVFWNNFAMLRLALLLSCLSLFEAPIAAQTPPSSVLATPAPGFASDGIFVAPPAAAPFRDSGVFNDPPPPPPKKIWSGSGEAGLNGATGNSEVLNIRLGMNGDRKTEANIFHTDLLYTLGKQEGRTIQNALLFNARDEVLFPGTPWSFFTATNIEYDELRLYKFRVGVYAGVGYIVVDDDTTTFKLRAGAGAVREIGGPKDRWVPELVFGYDFKRKFTDRQSIVSTLDYYPRIDNFAQYRIRAKLAYEVIIDPENGLALRLGAQSRYDSFPGPGFKRHDLNYFATLAWKF